MNFVRKGPRYLFFNSKYSNQLEEFFLKFLNGELTKLSDALEKSQEEDCIAFIIPNDVNKVRIKGTESVIFLPDSPFVVMEEIINHGMTDIINNVDSGAGQIVMRIPRDGKEVIQEIEETYQAKPVNLVEAIDQGTADDTILSFTDKPIRNKVKSLDLIKKNLLISKPVHNLYQELRRDAVRYITHGLDQDQWYELKINIYDSRDRYTLQYQRLSLILSDLEAGFILGESWTKDHAIALFSVIAYQIRLFTFLSPDEIKRILLSLEYDKNGKRLVDYDLYYNSKKVNWYKVVNKGKKIDRVNLAMGMRQELIANMSQETLDKLNNLEKQLIDG